MQQASSPLSIKMFSRATGGALDAINSEAPTPIASSERYNINANTNSLEGKSLDYSGTEDSALQVPILPPAGKMEAQAPDPTSAVARATAGLKKQKYRL